MNMRAREHTNVESFLFKSVSREVKEAVRNGR